MLITIYLFLIPKFLAVFQSHIKPFWIDAKTFALDTLFPKFCLGCETEGSFLCLDCQAGLKSAQNQNCIACQKPAAFGLTHPGCQTPFGADGLISFFDYGDKKVANTLIKGKYSFLPEVYEILGNLIALKIRTDPAFAHIASYTKNVLLVPIPLHPSRRRWRGFNQAQKLCKALGEQLNIPVLELLKRTKLTKTQKDLKKEQRQKNVADAFAISPNFKSFNLQSSNIILVDDVATTGATLRAAALVLKRSGAAKVICLAAARD